MSVVEDKQRTTDTVKTPEEFWSALGSIFPWLGSFVIILICVIYSAKKTIWMDEVFSLLLLQDPSLSHMLKSLRDGVEGGLPPYFVSAWLWGAIFGRSLLAFRLYSALAFGGAILVIWKPLIRRYSVPSVAFGLFVTVLQSQMVIVQATEARFYGLFTFAAMLMIAALLRLEDEFYKPRDLWLVSVASIFLVYSHLFGVVYSGVACIALLVWDHRHVRFRPKLYLVIASTWLTLVFWVPTILRVGDIGKPHSWMPVPWVPNVVDFYTFASLSFVPALLAALLLLAFSRIVPQEKPLSLAAYIGIGFLIVPAVMAFKSHFGVVVFNARYFLPSIFAAGIVIAAALDHLGVYPRAMTVRVSEAWAILIAILLIYPPTFYGALPKEEKYSQLAAVLEGNTPVIAEDANTFLPLSFLKNAKSPAYYYPLDWDEALKSSTLDATFHYKLLKIWKRNGYLSDHIVDSNDLLCRFNRFLVLDNPEMNWFEDRIKDKPEYEIRPGPAIPIPYWPGPTRTWLVTRKPNSVRESVGGSDHPSNAR